MRLTKFCLGAVLAGLAAAAPAPANHVLHERRDYMPQKWVKRSKVDAAATLPVRIGMTQSNLESGPDLLMDVYVLFPCSVYGLSPLTSSQVRT